MKESKIQLYLLITLLVMFSIKIIVDYNFEVKVKKTYEISMSELQEKIESLKKDSVETRGKYESELEKIAVLYDFVEMQNETIEKLNDEVKKIATQVNEVKGGNIRHTTRLNEIIDMIAYGTKDRSKMWSDLKTHNDALEYLFEENKRQDRINKQFNIIHKRFLDFLKAF